MALTTTVSPKELKRIASLCYEGFRVRVALANLTTQSFNESSLVSEWETIKVASANGYADFTDVLEVGAYDTADTRYEIGGQVGANTFVEAEFTASGIGYSFNRVFVVIGAPSGSGFVEELYVHSILTENPSIQLAPGTSITYRIQLAVDD